MIVYGMLVDKQKKITLSASIYNGPADETDAYQRLMSVIFW